VLAIVGMICLSPILAIVGLVRIRKSGARGRGLAIAGLAISGLWLTLIVVGVVAAILDTASRDESGQIVDPGSVRVTSIRPGDCLVTAPKGLVTSGADAVPCSQAHGAQALSAFDLPAGPFPGVAAVQQAAETGCTGRIGDELTQRIGDGELGLSYIHPTQRGWDQGDHQVVCFVTSEQGLLTETFPVR
jgi:hypothetical protein